MDKWISVEDRLPPHQKAPYVADQLLLAVDFGPDFDCLEDRYSVWFGIRVGRRGKKIKFWGLCSDGRTTDPTENLEYADIDEDVTHWMPFPIHPSLPEPPK